MSQSNQCDLEINGTIKFYYSYIHVFFKVLTESLQQIFKKERSQAFIQDFPRKRDPESVDLTIKINRDSFRGRDGV